jgi:PRC-barrel domain
MAERSILDGLGGGFHREDTMRAFAAAILLAAAGAVSAQERTLPGDNAVVRAGPPAAGAPLIAAVPEAGQVGSGSDRPVSLPSEQSEGELMSSDLIGRPLHGRDGRKLGEITDLLVDRNRRLAAVVMRLDAAGDRGKSVAVPFDALRRSSADRREVRLVVDLDESQLQDAKAFEHLSREAGQDDNQDLTARGGAATGGSVPPIR